MHRRFFILLAACLAFAVAIAASRTDAPAPRPAVAHSPAAFGSFGSLVAGAPRPAGPGRIPAGFRPH